jgi:choline transport protein
LVDANTEPQFFNVFARRTLSAIEYIGAFTLIGFFIIWIAVLTCLAPNSSASFVFTETITGLSVWSSTPIQWNIGLLSAVFPLSEFAGILHMSDEVKDAPRKVPHSMVLSVLFNGFMSLTMMITILFTLENAETALTAPTNGYPIVYAIYAATKSKVATEFMLSMTMWSEYSQKQISTPFAS